MLVAAVEHFETIWQEAVALFPDHFALMGKPMFDLLGGEATLEPDHRRYFEMERRGEIFFVALRSSGRLVGYWFCFVGPGLHYKTAVFADMDIWYLTPDFRVGIGGLLLARRVEAELRARGCVLWMAGEKLHRPAGRLYSLVGMQPVEQYWAKWLGDRK